MSEAYKCDMCDKFFCDVDGPEESMELHHAFQMIDFCEECWKRAEDYITTTSDGRIKFR